MNYFNKLFELKQYTYCPVFCLVIFSHKLATAALTGHVENIPHVPRFLGAGAQSGTIMCLHRIWPRKNWLRFRVFAFPIEIKEYL